MFDPGPAARKLIALTQRLSIGLKKATEAVVRGIKNRCRETHTAAGTLGSTDDGSRIPDVASKKLRSTAETQPGDITAKSNNDKHARFVEEYTARQQLWHRPALHDPTRGHLHAYRPDGEPAIPDDVSYRPAPLVMPSDYALVTGVQVKWANCYIIAGLNAIGKVEPGLLVDKVRQSGDEIVVRTHLGSYVMNATLPYTEDGKAAHTTSPDGSNLLAYIEKATAAHFGSYRATDNGNTADFMHWLIGDRYPQTNIVDVRTMSIGEMREVIGSNLPSAVNIVPPERIYDIPPNLEEHGLRKRHVYVPDKLDDDGSLLLENPWGKQHSTGMTLELLHEMNASLHWVSPNP